MIGRDRLAFRFRENFDWPLFVAVMSIAIVGVVNLYSATSPYIGDANRAGLADIYVSQVYWLVVGGLLAILVAFIDYRNFERLAYVIYAGGVATLVLVFAMASDIRGSTRWIKVGGLTFQPSEFMKIAIVLAVARYLADDPKIESRTFLDLAIPILICACPAALVMAQPDFGTAMVFVLSTASMLSMARIRGVTLGWLVTSAVGLGWFVWHYVLEQYQKARVVSFLDPEADKTGAGWHAFQSRTAIGNGGVWGEGFREGTQNQFGFLPDQYSDFPFSVFAEDWGFVGSLVLLSLYGFVCVWAIRIASMSKDRFGAAVAVGVGAIFFWQTLFNTGMATGILPVVGVTLPLFSYGGSSVLTTMISFGLLMNVSMRK